MLMTTWSINKNNTTVSYSDILDYDENFWRKNYDQWDVMNPGKLLDFFEPSSQIFYTVLNLLSLAIQNEVNFGFVLAPVEHLNNKGRDWGEKGRFPHVRN